MHMLSMRFYWVFCGGLGCFNDANCYIFDVNVSVFSGVGLVNKVCITVVPCLLIIVESRFLQLIEKHCSE